MAKSNPIEKAAENKVERTYGKYATKGRNGAASPAMSNIMQDKKAGRNPTGSMTRYAGGEMRAAYLNGVKLNGGVAGQLRAKNNALKKAGSTVYDPAKEFAFLRK